MILYIKNMNESIAKEILNWKYPEPYDLYNNVITDEALGELLSGAYHAVIDQNESLIGFYCTGKSAQVPVGNKYGAYKDDFIDMGLGMHPNLTGRGHGYEFCSFILTNIQKQYKNKPIRLTVATFNERAIHLYEKFGFVKNLEFSGPTTSFMTMLRN